MGGVLIGLTVLSGSVAGLVYGGIRWRSSLVRRLFATGLVLGLGSLPLLVARSFAGIMPFTLTAGIAITPMLVTMYSLLSRLVAKTSVTEGFAWIASSITVGSSTGTAGAGYLVDLSGSRGAFLLVAGCGLAAPLVVLVTRHLLARTPHDPTPATSRAVEPESTGGRGRQHDDPDRELEGAW
jgi:predicted MFS family arabinose efflux permease